MECSIEGGVFDVGSLYAHFQALQDSRNPKSLRYKLYHLSLKNGLPVVLNRNVWIRQCIAI